jgi:transposase InsO family protein
VWKLLVALATRVNDTRLRLITMELPPRDAQVSPWREVAVDLVGPWDIEIHGTTFKLQALTIIDTVTNYCKLVRILDKSAAHIAQMLENTWLSRYCKPLTCIHDQGGEFIGARFVTMLHQRGIQSKPTTVKNPQANAICERLHQKVANALRVVLRAHPPQTFDQLFLAMDSAISTAAYSARAAVHRTLGISPGALVFHRDMLLDIPIFADLKMLQQHQQAMIDRSLIRVNNRRVHHDYQPNDNVLIRAFNPKKLEPRFIGPF